MARLKSNKSSKSSKSSSKSSTSQPTEAPTATLSMDRDQSTLQSEPSTAQLALKSKMEEIASNVDQTVSTFSETVNALQGSVQYQVQMISDLSQIASSIGGSSTQVAEQFKPLLEMLQSNQDALGLIGEQVDAVKHMRGEVQERFESLSSELIAVKQLSSEDRVSRFINESLDREVSDRIEKWRADREKSRNKLTLLYEDIEDEVEKLSMLMNSAKPSELVETQNSLDLITRERDELREQLTSLRSRLNEVEDKESKARAELIALRSDGRPLMGEVEERERAVRERERELQNLEELEQQNATLKTKLETALQSNREVTSEHLDLLDRQKLQAEVDQLQTDIDERAQQRHRDQREIRSQKIEITNLRNERDTLNDLLKEKHKALEEIIADQRDEQDLKETISHQREQIQDLIEKSEEQMVTLNDHQTELVKLRAQALDEAELRNSLEMEFNEKFIAHRDQFRDEMGTIIDQKVNAHILVEREESLLTIKQYEEKLKELTEAKSQLVSDQVEFERIQAEWDSLRKEEEIKHCRELEEGSRQSRLKLAQEINEEKTKLLLELKIEHFDLEQSTQDLQRQKDLLTAQIETNELKSEDLKIKITDKEVQFAERSAQLAELNEQYRLLQQKEEELKHINLPVAERLKDLHQVYFEPQKSEPVDDEIEWLEEVSQGIKSEHFMFSERLLYAFHTSLKSAKMSPITILSGISGTGKSELPRLYSDYGGIHLLPIAVQPNWDSPEDLFGFFNYTDGRYRSTPLSQILWQNSLDHMSEPDKSLRDKVIMVLLDEMNIARVEYYFAELLSKLETRRNLTMQSVNRERASVLIDAGSNAKTNFFLDHNLLFVGTMNEDESTLSLSDKVKDRANMITFPAPKSFHQRTGEKVESQPRSTLLSRSSWESWCAAESKLTSEQISDIQAKLQTFNLGLREVNRAIGHRVSQAITQYLTLYPGIFGDEQAFAHAWSDIFSLKLAPKLNGIEMNSQRWKMCQREIEKVVPEELKTAFEQGSDFEYFQWMGGDSFAVTEED